MHRIDRTVFVKDSSTIDKIWWNTDGQMAIRFHHGATYRYENIWKEVFGRFISADSTGKFFAEYIKPFYKGIKLGEAK